ncbi:MAG: hypothetical protein ABIQ95_09535 [Bdellovibrionia bacterium]
MKAPLCKTYRYPVNTGFYRVHNTCPVFQIYEDNYCHVRNPDTMECFGGFGQVVVLPQTDFDKIIKNRNNPGFAKFNGFIRQKNLCEVYKIYDNTNYCHVTSPGQMNAFGGFGQVKLVSDQNGLLSGLNFTGSCQ